MVRDGGYRIVLTSDRTLMSENNGGVFLGFSACVPQGMMPDRAYFSLFCPSVGVKEDGSVSHAPCGTRKIEAALLRHGFGREEVVVAHPDHLDRAVGPETRAIGITENDPLGMGPATSTFTQLFGGEPYTAIKFREVLNSPPIKRFRPRIIIGGPGAWQLEDPDTLSAMGIDCVVLGEGEGVVGPLFEKAVDEDPLPPVVYGQVVPVDEIPSIMGPTAHGIVEIARGCGRGCAFCVPTMLRYRCLPIDHILREVEVNLRGGRQPLLHAEDVLRYKARGLDVNKEAVTGLFRAVMNHPGVRDVAISHFALSSVMSAPEVIEEISNIIGAGERFPWLGGQTGIETGSPRLIREHMAGKCMPFRPEDWPDLVISAFEVLSENHWVPCATLILGLPDETEGDIDQTIGLVEELRGFKSLIVPLFMVSTGALKSSVGSFTLERMTPKHTALFLGCWEHNFSWIPRLLEEFLEMSVRSRSVSYGLKLVTSHSIRHANRLISRCRDEYDHDLQRMIMDIRMGRGGKPSMIRLISRFIDGEKTPSIQQPRQLTAQH